MTENRKNVHFQLEDPNEAVALFGNADINLRTIENELAVKMITRGETIIISGNEKNC